MEESIGAGRRTVYGGQRYQRSKEESEVELEEEFEFLAAGGRRELESRAGASINGQHTIPASVQSMS